MGMGVLTAFPVISSSVGDVAAAAELLPLWDVSRTAFDALKDDSYTGQGIGGFGGNNICGTGTVWQLSRSLARIPNSCLESL